MRPSFRRPSSVPFNWPRESIHGLVSVHGHCVALSDSSRSCSPLEIDLGAAVHPDQVEPLLLVGPVQVDVPADRFIEHAEIDCHFGLLGDDRLGESRIAEPQASARNANDEPFWGMVADDGLEGLVQVDRAVGEPLDVEIALLDQELGIGGLSEEDLREAPVEDRAGRRQELIALCVVEHETLDRGRAGPGKRDRAELDAAGRENPVGGGLELPLRKRQARAPTAAPR